VLHQYFYGYDLAGNRTSEQIDAQLATSNYNNINQLTNQTIAQASSQAPTPQAAKSKTRTKAAKSTSKPKTILPNKEQPAPMAHSNP